MKKIAAVAVACLVATGAAQAQKAPQASSPWYGEIGYTVVKLSSDDGTWHPGVVRAVVGYDVAPNVSLEGMVAAGVRDDSTNVLGVGVDAKVNNAYGLFVKGKANLAPGLEAFGRIGYARTRVTASAMGAAYTDHDSDLAYGLGLNYSLSRTSYLGVDYMRYYNKDGVKADGLTLGVGMRF